MRGMEIPFQPTLHVGANQVTGILEAVRNTVLNWALDLESRGILGENMSFTQEEKQAASTAQTVNIENFQGVLGDVKDSMVTQNLSMTVGKGDFSSLSSYLGSFGLTESDINDLKKCIDEEPAPQTKGALGPKVSAWIGNMVGKSAAGSWNIALGTAGSLLAQAIWHFYGLP